MKKIIYKVLISKECKLEELGILSNGFIGCVRVVRWVVLDIGDFWF